MRILFMGTPDFAAASLKAMTDAGLDVVGDAIKCSKRGKADR